MSDYREFSPREKKYNKAKKQLQSFSLLIATIVMILGVSAIITAVIEAPQRRANKALATSHAALIASSLAASREALGLPGLFGPVPVLAENFALTPISGALISMPANGRVDMSYFNDTLFIGDSLTHGFQFYASGIKEAKYAAYIGVTPQMLISGTVKKENGEEVVAMDEIVAAAAKKVYILLGTNALNSSLTDDAIIKYYNDLLDTLLQKLAPGTKYYIQGMPPVSQAKSAEKGFDNARIKALNERFAQMAYNHGFYYLDLYPIFSNDGGFLKEELDGGDGLHLNGSGYSVWKEYLITHTGYNSDSLYIAGSPYMTKQP